MRRCPLEELVLHLHLLGIADVQEFLAHAIEPPAPQDVDRATDFLEVRQRQGAEARALLRGQVDGRSWRLTPRWPSRFLS